MPPNKPPGLTVFLPVFNTEKYIRLAIESILKQTYTDFELIIIDDKSTDKTLSIIKSINDPRIRIIENEVNHGKVNTITRLWNTGTGALITIHDADDISLPDRFQKQIDFLNHHPDIVLCGTNFISFLDNGKIIEYSSLETDPAIIQRGIQKSSQFHGPTIIFRKEIVPMVGGIFRYFIQAHDIDFTMRVAEKYKTANIPEYLYLYRHLPNSLTNIVAGYDLRRLGDAKLLYHLAKERRETGTDSLTENDIDKINLLMEEFTFEYMTDPTIALRRGVFRLLGMKMYGNAIKLSWIALTQKLNELNLKCFVYAVFATIKGKIQIFKGSDRIEPYLKFLND